jgi:anthranilate phosphoribosyltransferase
MIKDAICKVFENKDLSFEESESVMNEIMSGECTDAQIGAYLAALRMKGETIDEIAGSASIMRKKATKINAPANVIDTCGTGGDEQHTVNVSTAAAIVAAGAGAIVAKHGNRSVSSSSGSSQVLEELGVNINASKEIVENCIKECGIGFLFAPLLHDAMKFAIGPRKEMGARTIFNILGPLTNPADAKRQLMGVFSSTLVEPIAFVLKTIGIEKAMVVHGHDGLDEITISDETTAAFLENNEVKTMVIAPEDFGLKRSSLDAIRVKSAAESSTMIKRVLSGEKSSARDIVLLNAAAAIYVSDIAEDLEAGFEKAVDSIDSGKASEVLNKLIKLSEG